MDLEGIQQKSLFLAQLLSHKSRGKVLNSKLKALRLIRRGEALRGGRANTAPVPTLQPALKSSSLMLFPITEPRHLLWPKSPPTAQNWSQQQHFDVPVIPPASEAQGEGLLKPTWKAQGTASPGAGHCCLWWPNTPECLWGYGTFTRAGTFPRTLIITAEWQHCEGPRGCAAFRFA